MMDCLCDKLKMRRVDGEDKFVLLVEYQPMAAADKVPHTITSGTEANFAANFPAQVDSWVIKLVSGSITVDGITVNTAGHTRGAGSSQGKTYPKPTVIVNTVGSTYEWSAVE